EPPTKKNTWLRNAKCFILESVPTTNTLVLHLKSESKDPLYQMQKICRHSRERGNPDPSAWKFIE
ncbi:hypothetical protein, partial [Neisseria meningitidis]|uniref:hypothetical protein n=1 Tax=Neisseria meningitidis TaxID=487 RepID=UPI00214BB298